MTDRHEDTPTDDTNADNPLDEQDNPVGGDDTTEEQLDADNAVEEDMIKTLDPDDTPV
ncbi:hypothetical protein AB3M83_13135 [Microbacterium sp. 179-B 1A2 NHS]|uniref:hypothetical protein n=1 Tax=Microbacterium sp. 179-B 1A2 NHS TaxID=3142383 RepID=UPI0039A2CC4D